MDAHPRIEDRTSEEVNKETTTRHEDKKDIVRLTFENTTENLRTPKLRAIYDCGSPKMNYMTTKISISSTSMDPPNWDT
ncbi:hypothetical protein JTB14_002361 [Gonioctena quinquepunctata]|nr:hypothetical protein JTB14_002361 [Gonioctena quinquepunctata]